MTIEDIVLLAVPRHSCNRPYWAEWFSVAMAVTTPVSIGHHADRLDLRFKLIIHTVSGVKNSEFWKAVTLTYDLLQILDAAYLHGNSGYKMPICMVTSGYKMLPICMVTNGYKELSLP